MKRSQMINTTIDASYRFNKKNTSNVEGKMVNSPRQNVSEQLNLCVVPHNLFINKSIGVSNRGRSFRNFNSPHDVTDSRSGGVMSVI